MAPPTKSGPGFSLTRPASSRAMFPTPLSESERKDAFGKVQLFPQCLRCEFLEDDIHIHQEPASPHGPAPGLKCAVPQNEPRQFHYAPISARSADQIRTAGTQVDRNSTSDTSSSMDSSQPKFRRASVARSRMRPSRYAAAFTSRLARMSAVNSSYRTSTGSGTSNLRRSWSSNRMRPLRCTAHPPRCGTHAAGRARRPDAPAKSVPVPARRAGRPLRENRSLPAGI